MSRLLLSLLFCLPITACVTSAPQLPQAGAGVGVIVSTPGPSASVEAGGQIQPGGPIAPGTSTGAPVPLPDTRPPLNPNLPKNIETSGAAAPVISLAKAARASLRNGRTDEAGASLERALRIEPRNPWLYQALSALHIVTRQAEQAESEARKSISLGKRNPYLEVESWRLLAEARKLRGDKAGAATAQAKHEDLLLLISP